MRKSFAKFAVEPVYIRILQAHMHAIDVRCRRENETSNWQDGHFVRPTIHLQFIYRRRDCCRPKRKHTNVANSDNAKLSEYDINRGKE